MSGTVILVHGFMNKCIAMQYIGWHCRFYGYRTLGFNYRSNRYGLHTLQSLHAMVQSIKDGPIYFIGHSMGGLVIRNYIDQFQPSNVNAIITIGTPHNTSISARRFEKSLCGFLLGTAGNSGLTSRLSPWKHINIPIGCIAGVSKSILFKNWFLNDSDSVSDGTILVSEAYLNNASDIIIIPGSHTGMLFNKTVALQCVHFIKHNRFFT